MNRLQPCTSCNRHVRATDDACPFCAAPIAAASPRRIPTGRLTRAAVFASALATSAAACGSGQSKATDPQPVTSDAGLSNTVGDDEVMPADAGVPDPNDVYDDRYDRDYDPSHVPKPYGAPPARTRLV